MPVKLGFCDQQVIHGLAHFGDVVFAQDSGKKVGTRIRSGPDPLSSAQAGDNRYRARIGTAANCYCSAARWGGRGEPWSIGPPLDPFLTSSVVGTDV